MWQNKNNKLVQSYDFDNTKKLRGFFNWLSTRIDESSYVCKIVTSGSRMEVEIEDSGAEGLGVLLREIDDHYAHITDSANEMPLPEAGGLVRAKLYADGGSRGNPGPSAGGYVILNMENNVVKSNGKFLGVTTNNQAEYHSLKGGLEMAVTMGISELDVYMDSLLVVNQMKGIFKVKNRDLWPIHDAIKSLLPKFKRISFTHVPRELNKLADAVVNETLDDVTS